ncbi:hypothetical protein F4779DRAFT_33055 [Xylariaceae sp. FL0662B]|nr:hypothetical protein F4779DRAFT_33055 [Xylariaceae sp. FL0662B]
MPTFITRDEFSCGHTVQTFHRSLGNDGVFLTETIPVASRCLMCVCQTLLDASIDGVHAIPSSCLREVASHFRANMREYSSLACELRRLQRSIQQPGDEAEFCAAVVALAGFPAGSLPEIEARPWC